MFSERKLKNHQILEIFKYFNEKYSQPGETPAYSMFIYNNYNIFGPIDNEIKNKLNNVCPEEKTKMNEFENARKALVVKYADRDDNNELVMQNGKPIITEMYVEYYEELSKLEAQYNPAELSNKIREATNAVLAEDVVVRLYSIGINDFVNEAPPLIVGLFTFA